MVYKISIILINLFFIKAIKSQYSQPYYYIPSASTQSYGNSLTYSTQPSSQNYQTSTPQGFTATSSKSVVLSSEPKTYQAQSSQNPNARTEITEHSYDTVVDIARKCNPNTEIPTSYPCPCCKGYKAPDSKHNLLPPPPADAVLPGIISQLPPLIPSQNSNGYEQNKFDQNYRKEMEVPDTYNYGNPKYPTSGYSKTDYPNNIYGNNEYPTKVYSNTDYPTNGYGKTEYPTTGYGNTEYPNSRYAKSEYSTSSYGKTEYPNSRYGNTEYLTNGYGKTEYPNSGYGKPEYLNYGKSDSYTRSGKSPKLSVDGSLHNSISFMDDFLSSLGF